MSDKQKQQTRRAFIRDLSFWTGSSLFLSSLPWFAELKAENLDLKGVASDRVRLGIIGTGSRGILLMRHFLNNPQAEIVSICDDYPPSISAALEIMPHKPEIYTDYRKMLDQEQLDGVVIATPLHEHARMTIDAFSAGLHVLCEKSLARTVEDCHAMIQAHQKSGKMLLVGHQRFFDIKYIQGIEMIKRGDIGKVTHIHAYWHRNNNWRRPVPSSDLERKINWRLYKAYSAGLMTELASHQIQVANWILDEVPIQVSGSGSINYWNDGREVEDNVSTIYTYPSGVHLVYESVISNKFYGLEEQIMGNKGTVELENGKYYLEKPPEPKAILKLVNDIENGIFDRIPIGGASWIPETAQKNKGFYIHDEHPRPDSTMLLTEAFVQHIKTGKFSSRIAAEGYHSSVSALLGYQAIQENKIVQWPAAFRL